MTPGNANDPVGVRVAEFILLRGSPRLEQRVMSNAKMREGVKVEKEGYPSIYANGKTSHNSKLCNLRLLRHSRAPHYFPCEGAVRKLVFKR